MKGVPQFVTNTELQKITSSKSMNLLYKLCHNKDFIISELNLIQTLCKLLIWDHRPSR